MLSKHRKLFVAVAAIVAALPVAGLAQETNTIVGPTELRDFELQGNRVVAVPEPEPAQTTEQPPAEPLTGEPSSSAAETPVASRAVSRARAEAQRRSAPAPTVALQPAPPVTRQAAPPAPLAAAPPVRSAPVTALTHPGPEEGGFAPSWLIALFAALALGGAAYFALGRKRPEPVPAQASEYSRRAAQPAPAPKPSAPPAGSAASLRREGPRPWLELSFKPARAAATDAGAVLHYELTMRNIGNSAARSVRVDARMFNAGADQDREIGAFFSSAEQGSDDGALRTILPGGSIPVRGTLTLPKNQLREYKVQGRSLFIPVVAFNVVYEWGEGRTGKTSMSYLVGQEAQTPSEKMGAFRLDLGPRIYRSVGQRQHKLAEMV